MIFSLIIVGGALSGCGDGGGGDSGEKEKYTVSATSTEGGDISPSSLIVTGGSKAEFVITSDTGYEIESATGCKGTLTTESFSISNVASDCSALISFKKRTFSIEVSATPINGGNVSGAGDYVFSEKVTLTAEPAIGFNFSKWVDGNETLSVEAKYEFNSDSTRDITAVFDVSPNLTRVSLPKAGQDAELMPSINAPASKLWARTLEVTVGDGEGGYWFSSNGGETWTKNENILTQSIRYSKYEPDKILTIGGQKYFLSEDGGATWKSGAISTYSGDAYFQDAIFSGSEESNIYLATFSGSGGVYKSEDLGGTWKQVYNAEGKGGIEFLGKSLDNENVIYISGQLYSGMVMLKSTDNGSSFNSIVNGMSIGLYDNLKNGMRVSQINFEHIFVNGNLSTDGGENWKQISELKVNKSFWFEGDLFKIKDHSLMFSKDYGVTWNRLFDFIGPEGTNYYSLKINHISDESFYLNDSNYNYRLEKSFIRDQLRNFQ